MSIKTEEFTGDIVYYEFIKVNEKITYPSGCVLDDRYKWLEFYNYNSKVKLTAIYNNNDEIVEWYFDIAREIGKENGIPYEDDLYLDVVFEANGNILLLDEDELKAALNRLEISKEDYDMAYKEANNLIDNLKGNKGKIEKFTNMYLNEFKD